MKSLIKSSFSKNIQTSCSIILVIFILMAFDCHRYSFVAAKECVTIDVRNSPENLQSLRNCTIIKGYLHIVLIKGNYSDLNYTGYEFKELREVTEYVIFFDVAGLTSLGKLFPNLVVIRGRRLFLNYALIVDSMPDLQVLDLKSLILVQRGSVYVNRNPRLCGLERVNWNRLTSNRTSMNFIKSMNPIECDPLKGCDYHWSNLNCQKFEDANLINPMKTKCDSQCLGGCSQSKSNAHCVVCKNLNEENKCVSNCTIGKYLAEDIFRCYSKPLCKNEERYILKNKCVRYCGPGYISNKTSSECHSCEGKCKSECTVNEEIQYISDAERLKGCTIINGSLQIKLMNRIRYEDLDNYMVNITEITGFLKIYESEWLTSLDFLPNLRTIHGETLDLEKYSMIIYDNKNLKHLWNWTTTNNIVLKQGGIFLHGNYKLCNQDVHNLRHFVNHTSDVDIIQENDEEVLCDPKELDVIVDKISFTQVTLKWSIKSTTEKTQILYKKVPHKNIASNADKDYDINSEHMCFKELWAKELLLNADLKNISEYWTYTITGLEKYTQYAVIIKSYGAKNSTEYISFKSNTIYFTTLTDIPVTPRLQTNKKNSASITVSWNTDLTTKQNQIVEHYYLKIIPKRDDQAILDTRDYCADPLKPQNIDYLNGALNNDEEAFNYDDSDGDDGSNCCEQLEEEIEEKVFISLVNKKYRNSIYENHTNNCVYRPQSGEYCIQNKTTEFTVENLKYYTLYVFLFHACNHIGCSSYSLHSERTEPLPDADDTELRIENGNQRNEYKFYFVQPKNPNGITVAYNFEYRYRYKNDFTGQPMCITRNQYEKYNYSITVTIKHSIFDARVRTISLAGPGRPTDWISYKSPAPPIEEKPKQTTDTMVIFCSIGLCAIIMAFGWIIYKHFILRRPLNCEESHSDEQILLEDFEKDIFEDSTEEINL